MIRALIAASARHRAVVLVLAAMLSAASWWAVTTVPLDAVPDLGDPQVIVYTEWMGRSPDLVEDQVTYPLASALLGAPRVTDVRGFSMFGMSFIYVLFEEGTDVYWARSRVLEYLSSLGGRLPDGVRPTLGPDATGIGWVFQYALVDRSGTHDLAELRTFQDYVLRYALASVPGVAEVATVGGFQKQFQITVDPERLANLGLTLSDVLRAVRRSNADVGGRVLEMSGREYFVRGRGYVKSLDDLRAIGLRTGPTGAPITLGDVGEVAFGPEIRRGLADWNGDGEVVGGIVVARYGENALHLIDRVKARLAELAPSFPSGVTAEIAYDRSDLIRRAVGTLRGALAEEMLVVALVIFIFLLHLGSSLVPIVMLPLAVAASFIPMRLLGVTSNIMSLGGIAIAIGAMVDAAIVLVENAHKRLETADPGTPRDRVLIEAAQEVGPSIFFALLIMTVAFLPIFALEGQAGRLFIPLAFTKTSAMATAAILSVTLVPALMAFFIRGRIRHEHEHPVSRILIGLYKPFVFVALRNPRTTIGMGLLAVASAVPIALQLGTEFMPPLDEGDLLYMPTTMPNISIDEARRDLQMQDTVLRGFPEVAAVMGKVGRAETATDPAPLSMVETVVRLKPRDQWRRIHVDRFYSAWAPAFLADPLRRIWPEERPLTMEELQSEMNNALTFPGWTNALTMPIKTRVDMLTTGIRTPVGIKVFGPDLAVVEKVGVALEGIVQKVAGTRSAFYERNAGGLYVDITPDRAALARYGLTVQDVNDVIEVALGGEPIGTTVQGRARHTINVRLPRDFRDRLPAIREILIPLRAPGGEGGMEMGKTGARSVEDTGIRLAQAMGGMEGGSKQQGGAAFDTMPRLDTGAMAPGGMPSMPVMPKMPSMDRGGMSGAAPAPEAKRPQVGAFVPLGQIARVEIVEGPPMVRSEAGQLAGYVYVDVDTQARDIGGYVDDAKSAVQRAIHEGRLVLPPGVGLAWTGQYELLARMEERMKVVVPLTLMLVVLLLILNFRNITEALIVLLSVPFSLVGSVWLLWLLDYRLSTAVWVGVIALVGLAAETGIVMVVYLDAAYERRKRAGKVRDLNDIIWAHMEGTVQRVRPKLMTVATMLFGLVPLLWADGSGADVMKRIAAPMVGGLLSSAFLTLEIIPVVYTYWRLAQIRMERRAAA
ncbi:MAG: efflux RND transporter permease subunit [Deltaproteobacteria bacterium]|nr:efflux RND transporter permease subunit [Deltaproteobacteria bacterium]